MKISLTHPRALAAAAMALAGLAATATAHAGSDVHFSIGLSVPGVVVQASPVYTRPGTVYVQPAPVVVRPAPVYYGRGPWGDRDHDGIPNFRDRHDNRRHHGHWGPHARGPMIDSDRDGVPDRYDRYPGNPYYR